MIIGKYWVGLTLMQLSVYGFNTDQMLNKPSKPDFNRFSDVLNEQEGAGQ